MGFWKNLFTDKPKDEWIPVAKCIMDGHYTDSRDLFNIMFIFLEKSVSKQRCVKIIHSDDNPSAKYTPTLRAEHARGRFQFNWYDWENHNGPLPKSLVSPGGGPGRANVVPMSQEHVPVPPPPAKKSVPKVKKDDANNIIKVDFTS